MIITLPNAGYVQATPKFLDFSSSPPTNFGGVHQKIIRPGSRFALQITLPPKRYSHLSGEFPGLTDDEARIWISKLLQAKHGEARYPWPQPGVNSIAGTKRVNGAAQQGSSLITDGWPANQEYKEGQFFHILHQGNNYLHMITADGQADAAGNATLPIFPMLRIEPADNALIDFDAVIQGDLEGDEQEWTIDRIAATGISFMIKEKR